MNTNTQTIHDLTLLYIEHALTEVGLLHDAALIEPTLKKFHIERHYAHFHGFTPKQGRFRPRAGFKPRAVYTVTDVHGTPLGDPTHEDDLGHQYREDVILDTIDANLAAMRADHADLVALHRAGDGGAAPSFRYKPGGGLASRTDTEANLEKQKAVLREAIEQMRLEHEIEQNGLNAVLHQKKQAENERDDATRKARAAIAREQQAQRIIDRAQRIQKRDALRRGALPSPWGTDATAKEDNGPEFA